MSGRHAKPRRARGRAYRIRVRAERRMPIDYPKLSRALLEQAARDQRVRAETEAVAAAAQAAGEGDPERKRTQDQQQQGGTEVGDGD